MAVLAYLEQEGAPDLRIYAPGTDPELVKVPGWNAAASSDGDFLLISGTPRPVKRKNRQRNGTNTTVSRIHGGETIRIRPTTSGVMSAHAYRLDGKCVWRCMRRPVRAGCAVDIPCDNRQIRNSLLLIIVEINGERIAQSLIEMIR